MKTVMKTVIAMSVIAFASVSMANPKCAHRSGSDMFDSTNPVKVVNTDKKASTSVRKGTK